MSTTTNVIKLHDTGERVRYFSKRSWNRIYYSFDHELTWHPSKLKALQAVVDRMVEMPDGTFVKAS